MRDRLPHLELPAPIAACEADIHKALIVCPASVKAQWAKAGDVHARALHGPAWYLATRMTRVTNFGDPSFEPTDEELAELMREAFADVPVRSAAALSRIRQEIEGLREQAMARLEQRLRGLK